MAKRCVQCAVCTVHCNGNRANSCREITNHKRGEWNFVAASTTTTRGKIEKRTQRDHTKCKSVSKSRQTNTRHTCCVESHQNEPHIRFLLAEQVRFFIFLRIIISVTKTNCYSYYVGTCTEFVYYELWPKDEQGSPSVHQRVERQNCAERWESKWIDVCGKI